MTDVNTPGRSSERRALSDASRRDLLTLAPIAALALAGSAPAPADAHAGSATATGEVSVTAFGARGDGRTDDHAAITAAAAEASRRGCDLIFPAGVYRFDRTLELGFGGLRIFGRGKATLLFQGRGHAVSIDAGERAIHYHHHLENLLVMGTGSPDQHGILIRNFVHGIRRNLRVTNIGGIAFDIAGDVLSTYDHCRVADNETARPDRFPEIDFRIRGTASVSATTACLFLNCMAERAGKIGWDVEKCDNCRWIGGTAEGLDGLGVRIAATSGGNVFESMFMEHNTAGDIACAGSDNSFRDCTASSRAATSPYENIPSVTVAAGSRGFAFSGGAAYAIVIERGAENTRIAHTVIDFRIADAGRGTVVQGCRQGYESATTFPGQTLGNVDNPDPLALDWYREAAFVPVVAGSEKPGAISIDVRQGTSTRIGNVVFISLTARVGGVRSPASGGLVIDGLPYVANTVAVFTVAADGGPAGWKALTEVGTKRLRIVAESGGGLVPVDPAALAAGVVLTISGHYMT